MGRLFKRSIQIAHPILCAGMAIAVSSCNFADAQPSDNGQSGPLNGFSGFLVIGRETMAFEQCRSDSKYECPTLITENLCWIQPSEKASRQLSGAFNEQDRSAFGVFRIAFMGRKSSGLNYGHLGEYSCEIFVDSVTFVEHYDWLPPFETPEK